MHSDSRHLLACLWNICPCPCRRTSTTRLCPWLDTELMRSTTWRYTSLLCRLPTKIKTESRNECIAFANVFECVSVSKQEIMARGTLVICLTVRSRADVIADRAVDLSRRRRWRARSRHEPELEQAAAHVGVDEHLPAQIASALRRCGLALHRRNFSARHGGGHAARLAIQRQATQCCSIRLRALTCMRSSHIMLKL